jgi:hypothetical protein
LNFEVYQEKTGRYRWRLRDADGKIVTLPKYDFTSDWPEEEKVRVDRNVQAGLRALSERQAKLTP